MKRHRPAQIKTENTCIYFLFNVQPLHVTSIFINMIAVRRRHKSAGVSQSGLGARPWAPTFLLLVARAAVAVPVRRVDDLLLASRLNLANALHPHVEAGVKVGVKRFSA